VVSLFVPWLADAARLTGYPVVEVDGWRTRGHGGFRVVEGIVAHHTADGPGEYPSLRIVRDGRSDLPGPLSNYGLGRSGTVYVVAAGQCWHAGASQWAGFRDLNDEFLGIEAESRGTVDDWSAAERDAYDRLCAAALHYMRRGAERLAGHREVCIPSGRKIDPAFIDMPAMRGRVARMLLDPLARIPRTGGAPPSMPGGTAPTTRGDEMIIPCTLRRDDPSNPKRLWGGFKVERGKDLRGHDSRAFDTAFFSVKTLYGSASLRVAAQDSAGNVIQWWPARGYATLGVNAELVDEVPPGTRFVTVEGVADPLTEVVATGIGIAK
jgi:hypothetical protein